MTQETILTETQVPTSPQEQPKKKGWRFPTAYSVLFIVMMLAAALTYIVPAGKYAKLSYNGDAKSFVITSPNEEVKNLPGTQETLDTLNVKINLKQFEDGGINKPIAIPDTYEKVESNPTTLGDFVLAPIDGTTDSFEIMLFILVIGGIIGILNSSGAINAGFAALSRATKGREFVLIILVTFLIAAGGTTFGMAEETVALYPILIPIFLVAGYDALVGVAAIYLGSSIGTMFSTVNPFSSIIASAAAGTSYVEGITFRLIGLFIGVLLVTFYILRYASKVKRDPSKSLIYTQKADIEAAMLDHSGDVAPPFTGARAIMIAIFILAFFTMIWGVSAGGWWFKEMTALFLVAGVAICFVACLFLKMSEGDVVNDFISGAADLVGVGLIIGIARAINMLLEKGLVSDTLLFMSTQMIEGMNPMMFVIVMLFIFIVLGFFIPSSSGLAVLAMPIMAPLADTVGLPRDIIVSAYQYGQGVMAFITPTGLILVALSLVHVTYDKWLKFVLPLLMLVFALSITMLLAQVHFA